MNTTNRRLTIKELKWIKKTTEYCKENRYFCIIMNIHPLTAFIYSEGGFYIEKKVMSKKDQEFS